MKTFHEWVAERHPEAIEEGFFKNLALGAAIGAGAMGMGGKFLPTSVHPTTHRSAATARADDMDDGIASVNSKEAKLRAAADRVGIPKAQQNNLKGHMVGGIVVSVNGRKVRLTPNEAEHVKAVQQIARSMGN
jgi:hypothetical protein